LAMWRANAPKKSDFFSRFDLFDVDNYLFVLYGMRFPTHPKRMTPYEQEVFMDEIKKVKVHGDHLSRQLLGHREWINKFLAAYRQSMAH
jgi:tryptophan halogenase